MKSLDWQALDRLGVDLAEAVGAPERWPDLLGAFEAAMRARGVGLLPVEPRPDFFWSRSMDESFAAYVAEGWYLDGRDPYRRAIPRHRRGLISTDEDIFAPEELAHTPYFNDFARRRDLGRWLGAPVRIDGDLHSLSLHRSFGQAAFDAGDRVAVGRFAARLREVASLCAGIARRHLTGVADALQLVDQPALALHATGRVLAMNAGAEALMGPDFRLSGGLLRLGDREAAKQLESIILKARWSPEGAVLGATPVLLGRRNGASPLWLKALPVDGAARSRFLGARLLLLLREVEPVHPPGEEALRAVFGLTPAESRLAARLARGETMEEAAEALAISRETARSQAKAVYAKTGVNRQAGLVALVLSLS